MGYSLKPPRNSLFKYTKLEKKIQRNIYGNINDYKKLKKNLIDFNPDIIFHLAAQSLVLESYKKPINTFQVNVIGTLNLLNIIKYLKKKGSAVVVTSDKVYETKIKKDYNEYDEIGATDPYGTSKTCSEHVAKLYNDRILNKKYFNIATARAGNVIGGGDYSKDRLIPDFFKAQRGKTLYIRNSNYVRPWQFVLEPLSGYLILAEKLYKKKLDLDNIAWNFAPKKNNKLSVKSLILKLNLISKNKVKFKLLKNNKRLKETSYLGLNSDKSKKYLKWSGKYTINESLQEIVQWYDKINYKKDNYYLCVNQIKKYFKTNE